MDGVDLGSLFRPHRYRASLAREGRGRKCQGPGWNDSVDERRLWRLPGHRAFLAGEKCGCECQGQRWMDALVLGSLFGPYRYCTRLAREGRERECNGCSRKNGVDER